MEPLARERIRQFLPLCSHPFPCCHKPRFTDAQPTNPVGTSFTSGISSDVSYPHRCLFISPSDCPAGENLSSGRWPPALPSPLPRHGRTGLFRIRRTASFSPDRIYSAKSSSEATGALAFDIQITYSRRQFRSKQIVECSDRLKRRLGIRHRSRLRAVYGWWCSLWYSNASNAE